MEKKVKDFKDVDIKALYEEDHDIMVYAQNINNDIRSRVNEIIAFAKEAGYKKIGIAHCISVTREAKILADILEQEFEVVKVSCKIGGISKKELIGSGWGSACNPIMQAEMLNEEETDFNIVMALCVGHDMLFGKYSKAMSTTLIVKDEMYGNDPTRGL